MEQCLQEFESGGDSQDIALLDNVQELPGSQNSQHIAEQHHGSFNNMKASSSKDLSLSSELDDRARDAFVG